MDAKTLPNGLVRQLNRLGFALCSAPLDASHLDFIRLSQDAEMRLRLSRPSNEHWHIQVFLRRLRKDWLQVPLDGFGRTTDDAALLLTTRELRQFPAVFDRAIAPLADGTLGP